MRFYEITADLGDKFFKKLKSDEKFRDNFSRDAIIQANDFFRNHDDKIFVFVVAYRLKKLILGVVFLETNGTAAVAESSASEFMKSLDVPHSEMKIEETTLHNISRLISSADNNNYLTDDDDTLEELGLHKAVGRRSDFGFSERIETAEHTKKELFERAEKLFCGESLKPELERIYMGGKQMSAKGHPVHYAIQSDSPDVRREIVRIIFSALRANGRVENARYSILNCSEDDECQADVDFLPFYRANSGGMVVMDYVKKKEGDDDLAVPGICGIKDMCEAAKRRKNDTLSVLCVPRSPDSIQEAFLEHMDGMTFIPLREETIFGKDAERYLKSAAESANVKPNKSLYEIIRDKEKGFLAADLDMEFDRWLSKTLKTNVYPQYAKLGGDAYLSCKKNPKGSAYKALDDMIGLSEAKSVIRKAVNYYKAQKMFRDRGMDGDKAAMHMIFTGNPGSAKTTAARLFARIMKENGLLSAGNLIEVGRADLVGKYVGWTAPAVKAKFRQARGSVLFIDEAYSLVDDRSGSYGDEAINAIVQEMENNREDIAVIFAGYPDKMEKFLETNPGLRSRVAFHVRFDDYSPDELYGILEHMAAGRGIRIAPDAREKLAPIFGAATRSADFGNGRFVRNLFEQAKMNQADRLVTMDSRDISGEDVKTLMASDFEMPAALKPAGRAIGFAA
ncbi:MAG: AAA family ATPase [Synergistaceae bacterium]|jgi:SpoVK/Ycf46/Vps4 family AAA+-type ATPase|nr:AAA family ATPase [Synergistaceae bacterium]